MLLIHIIIKNLFGIDTQGDRNRTNNMFVELSILKTLGRVVYSHRKSAVYHSASVRI